MGLSQYFGENLNICFVPGCFNHCCNITRLKRLALEGVTIFMIWNFAQTSSQWKCRYLLIKTNACLKKQYIFFVGRMRSTNSFEHLVYLFICVCVYLLIKWPACLLYRSRHGELGQRPAGCEHVQLSSETQQKLVQRVPLLCQLSVSAAVQLRGRSISRTEETSQTVPRRALHTGALVLMTSAETCQETGFLVPRQKTQHKNGGEKNKENILGILCCQGDKEMYKKYYQLITGRSEPVPLLIESLEWLLATLQQLRDACRLFFVLFLWFQN